jgi:hypothetical protein
MTGDTVECFNCGRPNPSWAQVCRSCGVPLRAGGSRTQASGPVPTDRDSLISIAAGLGAVVLAIIVGVFVSGMIPEAPPPPVETPSPPPSVSGLPSPSLPASVPPAGEGSPAPSQALPGTVSFGFGLNQSTNEVLDVTDTFTTGTRFCHSITLAEPFGTEQVLEEVLKIEENGELTVVQERSPLGVDPAATTAGFCANANGLINGWGVGQFLIRDYRPGETPVLLAEGRFTLAR